MLTGIPFSSLWIRFGAAGHFSCPKCGQKRRCKNYRAWRFLALFGVPLLPLEPAKTSKSCSSCGGTFVQDPHLGPLDASDETVDRCIRRIKVLLRLASAISPGPSRGSVQEVYEILSEDPDDSMHLEKDLAWIRRQFFSKDQLALMSGEAAGTPASGIIGLIRGQMTTEKCLRTVEKALRTAAPYLMRRDRHRVLQETFLQAAADGVFQKGEQGVASKVIEVLKIRPAELKAIIEETIETMKERLKLQVEI